MDLITVAPKTASAYAIRVRGHEVTCDMSEKEGGRDEGPSPVELLAGSLGACIAIMVGRYCRNHGWSDGKVGVNLTLELADDPKRVKGIVADLEVPQDVPPDRIEAIRRVAGFCPVHQTLKNPPDVDLDITQ
jgi:putative redox protein